MAALLVSLAVMAVLMSVALPVWRHEAQREKEAELVFRGQQYIRAIRLFQMKTGTLPTSVDLLVQGHYLRKKFKDPITNDDFDLVGPGGVPGQTGLPGGATPPGRGGSPTTQGGRGTSSGSGVPPSQTMSSTSGTAPTGTVPGGMMGVRSKSKDESIRLYLGRNHYNEWVFLYAQGPAGGGRGQPGGGPQRGLPGGGGGRGGGPGGGGPGGGGPGGGGPGGGGPGRGGVGGPGRNGPPVIGPGRGRQDL